MRALFSLLTAFTLLPACGPATPPEECSETAKIRGYRDEDRDGHGDPATETMVCEVGVAGWVSTGLDCDDTRSEVNVDQLEVCDGLDNDCDQTADDGLRGITYFADQDLDGFGHPDLTTEACTPPPGFVENDADCDDGDPLSFPGSEEFCDDKDNDCDGLIDDADPSVDRETSPWWYGDNDGDGYGNPDMATQRCDKPNPTAVDNADDCNDASVGISPDAQELCDGFDNDCDGLIDDSDPTLNPVGMDTWYYDFDGDGLGDAAFPVQACNQPWFYVGNQGDCDDLDPFVLDATSTFWMVDGDGDTYGDPTIPATGPDCDPPAGTGYTPQGVGDDCDDTEAAINPGATEVCDTLDNDCDGLTDDLDPTLDLNTTNTYYADTDGDLFGDVTTAFEACVRPPNTVSEATDCDDSTAAINPIAPEICNNIDDDCNNLIDEADPGLDQASAPNWYIDFDGDGWGDPTGGVTVACTQPPGLVDNDLDCDDNDPDILGDVDWIADNDNDGVGAGAVIIHDCVPPGPNTVPDLGPQDCDDNDPTSFPGADELCGDGLDQDCSGADQACPPDTCFDANNAVPYTTDTTFVHDLTTYANDVSFADFNPCTASPTDGTDAILPVQIAPGAAFQATMSGVGDASLYLVSTCTAPNPATQCNVGSDNVAGGGGTEHVWYTNLGATTQTLFLVADCAGPCSDYELSLDFGAPALADTCTDLAGDAPLTTGGHSFRGSLAAFSDDADLGPLGCTGIESGGGEAFLAVDLNAGETLDVLSYTQNLDDSSVYLVDNCADPFGTCLVGADLNGAGNSETLSYTNGTLVTDRVYLVLDCYLPSCREFTAKLSID